MAKAWRRWRQSWRNGGESVAAWRRGVVAKKRSDGPENEMAKAISLSKENQRGVKAAKWRQ
jgi:hypothetical protein